MKRLWPILALILVAATPEETKLFRVAQTAFEDRLYDFAERQLREFLQKFPTADQAENARLMLAQSQLKLGNWEAAVKTLDAGMAGRPADQWPDGFQYWRAEALLGGELFAEAERGFAALVSRSPQGLSRAPAQFGLAYAQFKQSRYAEAGATLDELAKLSQRERLMLESRLLRGQIFMALEKHNEAESVFEELVKRDPESRWAFRAQRWRGELAARRQEWDKAQQRYAVVLESFQKSPNKPVDTQLAAEAWAGLGWVQFQQGQFEVAVTSFAQAFSIARAASLRRETILKLSESYIRAGKITAGVARLKDFLADNPKDPLGEEVQFAIGNLFFARNEFGAALPEYVALTSRYPKGKLIARASFQAGWCAVKLGRLAEGAGHFQRAFTEAGADGALGAEALFKLGDTQFELGQLAEAIGSYQRLTSSFTESPLVERALFQLGHVYQRMQNGEAAVHVFQSLVTQFPQGELGAEAQFQIGLIHVTTGNEESARTAFAQVARQFPQSRWAAQGQLAVGESYYREGKYDAAMAEFDRLITAAPDTELGQRAFYNRGWCSYAKGQAEQTLQDFVGFVQKYPASALAPDVEFWIGDYFARQKDYVKAQEHFLAIHKNYRDSKLADSGLFMAARAAYSRQDYKNAIELFETLIKTYPNSSWRCDARFGQGDALTELGQFNDALLVFDAVIREFPECYLQCEAMGRKADCQFTLERYDDAIAGFQAARECAVKAEPAFLNQIAYKIGVSYEKLGKGDEALAQYTKVVYETREWPDPTTPPECFWLSKAGLAAAGLKEQRQSWRDAITLYQRLLEVCPDMKDLLEERIRKIRVEHFILF